MLANFPFSLGVLGLGWWLAGRISRRQPRAKVLSRGQPLSTSLPDQLSVVSYNILSDSLVMGNQAYGYVNPLFLCWEYRWSVLREELKGFDADLVFLQEVERAR